jgi:hypothetical protein
MEIELMTNIVKKEKLQTLLAMNTFEERHYYDCLGDIDDLKFNDDEYLKSCPMDAIKELKLLPDADYELCAALLTMVLREDHWCNGSFEQRFKNGEVTPILHRMIALV